MKTNETMISLALKQLKSDLYRIYEVWLEVGNGDMSVLESRMDEIRDTFVERTSKYLSDQAQTNFFISAYEDAFIAILNDAEKV